MAPAPPPAASTAHCSLPRALAWCTLPFLPPACSVLLTNCFPLPLLFSFCWPEEREIHRSEKLREGDLRSAFFLQSFPALGRPYPTLPHTWGAQPEAATPPDSSQRAGGLSAQQQPSLTATEKPTAILTPHSATYLMEGLEAFLVSFSRRFSFVLVLFLMETCSVRV